MSRVVIGYCVAVPRSHWSAVPTPLFIYISHLLRDSFSVSQQPPIWETPSNYSMGCSSVTLSFVISSTVTALSDCLTPASQPRVEASSNIVDRSGRGQVVGPGGDRSQHPRWCWVRLRCVYSYITTTAFTFIRSLPRNTPPPRCVLHFNIAACFSSEETLSF